jgi:glycosyltransferase involved in cell wall biosynthesis
MLYVEGKQNGYCNDVETALGGGSTLLQRKPLRIALNAITSKGGARVYLWELASALATIDGVDVVLLVGSEDVIDLPPLLRSGVCRVSISSRRSFLQTFRQKRIREALLREEIDLYHIPNTMPLLRKPIPTVVTIHDLVELRVRKYGVLRTAYRFITNFIAAHLADRVVTVSQSSKRDIVHFLRIPPSKVTVIYNGVSEAFHPLDRQQCKEYLASQYSIEGNFLLAPGGLSKNKNIPGLLAAMRLLKGRGMSESLVLLGNKEDREFKYVANHIARSRLGGAIICPGFIPGEDLPVFYNAACLVVYPTLYEGFGFPVLEAMACGTPVVASNDSSLPEVAGDAALLVDPRNPKEIADAIQRVLTDEMQRAQLSFLGLARARQFTWEQTAKETLKVFLDVGASEQLKRVESLERAI